MLGRGFDRKTITRTPAFSPLPGQEILRPCLITSLEPESGHFAGGYQLVLRGSGFLAVSAKAKKRERILSLGAFANENPEEEQYPDDWNDARGDSMATPPFVQVCFKRRSDGHTVVASATSVTPWSVHCIVPDLSLFQSLSSVSVSVIFPKHHSKRCASTRRFQLLQENPPCYPKISSLGWHWQHVDGAKYCAGLFHDRGTKSEISLLRHRHSEPQRDCQACKTNPSSSMQHYGTAIIQFTDDSSDADGPGEGGVHSLLLHRLEQEQKINIQLSSRLQLCVDRRFERCTNAGITFDASYRRLVMSAIRSYVNCLH